MGWFDRKVPEVDEDELHPQGQPKPAAAQPKPQAQPAAAQSKPKPAAEAKPAATEAKPKTAASSGPAPSFGIQKAIELMRELPDDNVALVVRVVKTTLESANVSVEAIIKDADQKTGRIEDRITRLEGEIEELEEEIEHRKAEIKMLKDDHAETKAVRGKLELSLEPPKAKAGGKAAAPSAGSSGASVAAPVLTGPKPAATVPKSGASGLLPSAPSLGKPSSD